MQQVTASATGNDFQGDEPKAKPWRNLEKWQQTPLLRAISNTDKNWLLTHCVNRWQGLHNSLFAWRQDMQKWERQSEGDFSDRKKAQDPVNQATTRDIFQDQNDTLGLVNGFCDFHYSQAKDDLFGTRPWLAIAPEGKADIDLAETITRHTQWKFGHSNLEPRLLDALRVSTWGGTCFLKSGWHVEAESFLKSEFIAIDTATGEPILNPDGKTITSKEEVEALIEAGLPLDPAAVDWKENQTEDLLSVYSNVSTSIIDFNDVAFDQMAPELDLRYTDVFCRFKMGLLDAMEKYKIPESEKNTLLGAYTGYDENARAHRNETGTDFAESFEERANPVVTLVEGFVRCRPSQNRPVSRLHVIFSPDLHILFKADFLANVTPGALLPVFPVRINKMPNRILGVGYFEKFEDFNNAVDRLYNTTTYRNKFSQHVYTACDPSVLKDGGEGVDVQSLDPKTPFELATGKTIQEFIQFAVMPDSTAKSIELMNQMMQMAQMISGITSAAQGELKGVPNATTATGVKDLQSRGATILKTPIDEQKEDIRKIVEFAVHVLYANQDTDETFTWSEGKNAELLTLQANDVSGLRANVTLTMSQSQNTRKIESAQTAIGLVQSYLMIPEHDKVAAKPVFEQALSALGFHNASDVLRDGIVTLESLLEIVPPDLQPMIQAAIAQEQSGMMPPGAGVEPDPAFLDPATPLPGEEEELPPPDNPEAAAMMAQ
jgi:hypothetical protein